MVLLAAVGTGAWAVFGRAGHPFDDARACEGSTVPLQPALGQARLSLPVDATDVHYYSYAGRAADGTVLAVSFHSTRQAMNTYLRRTGLVTEGLDSLDDGRFTLGDTGKDPATLHLCGDAPYIQAPAVLIEKERPRSDGAREVVDVAAQLTEAGLGGLRQETWVQLTVREPAG
ncbi:hypothetical protein [Streptomyces sp. VRA16 Mangrove soil]|uniref:hypothetical protein n=1 Tax=Streptomyces sp. VRA16 Mangrove soil TaxID=2817434 RepID=UPI001A9EEBD6|nr:hypothetical protein [Streptomyces sp. VRA16 Mangrove soil]MBO1330344.1 hypothetical protein [Streptomyces sp. VRA16 Mangrove soil]